MTLWLGQLRKLYIRIGKTHVSSPQANQGIISASTDYITQNFLHYDRNGQNKYNLIFSTSVCLFHFNLF